MDNFFAVFGATCMFFLIIALFFVPVAIGVDVDENAKCEMLGYATEIHLRGENYCIGFKDGIISKVGVYGYDNIDEEWTVTQEFVLVANE